MISGPTYIDLHVYISTTVGGPQYQETHRDTTIVPDLHHRSLQSRDHLPSPLIESTFDRTHNSLRLPGYLATDSNLDSSYLQHWKEDITSQIYSSSLSTVETNPRSIPTR
jgi:hypothetical protein